ncbi:MAG: hypothetical protein HDP34_01605 [Clostridia bacterium]|nr:hypothetical protein [Clostridia bacterium]
MNFLYIALIAAQVAAIVFLCLYIPAFLPVAVVVLTAWAITTVTAVILFARSSAAEVKSAWFVLITAIPVAGSVIYLLATLKRPDCGVLDVEKEYVGGGLEAAAKSLCGTVESGYDRAEYFSSGTEYFKVLISEIERAKESVYIEYFIIARGHIFNAVCEALQKAAKNGAEIKIILDGIGSLLRIGKRDIKRLKELGAEVKTFHRLTPYPRPNLNFRDHRKIVTVDGKTAFTGGINLADEYANITSPYGYWKDSGLVIYGAAAKIFEGMFLAVWQKKYTMSAPRGGKARCLPFYDSPHSRAFFEDACVYAINNSVGRVHIMTPYFCVSEKTAAALVFAARRGVDIKIILPHIPDKKYAFEISKAYAKELQLSGIKFYEFTPGFMHAKCLVCDNQVFLGSYNFDSRSTRLNYECGAVFGEEMTEKAELDFNECLALSSEFSEGKITAFRKTYRFILKLLAPLI